jgi:hypothetical protein
MIPGTIENILKIYDLASKTERAEGLPYYFRLSRTIEGLGAHYGYPFHLAAAVFAALSPNVGYMPNLRSAASVLKGHKEGVHVDLIKVATYNHCRDRAFSYLDGVSFDATVDGPKIRNFYQNIIEPWHPEPVTIDGHAVNIWRGFRVTLKEVAGKGGFKYKPVADDYRAAARALGLLPNQLQATTWTCWKRIHAVLSIPETPQLGLFSDNSDLWKTIVAAGDIEPYEFFSVPSPSTMKRPALEAGAD